jgi:hypothetical protein
MSERTIGTVLVAAMEQSAEDLIKARDITKIPFKLNIFAWISQIVQLRKLVNLVEELLRQSQLKTEPVVTRWIDAKNVPYLAIIEGDRVRLVGGDGAEYDPTLPVRNLDDPISEGILVSASMATPKMVWRSGEQEVIVEAGAISLQVQVFAGSVMAFGTELQVGAEPSFINAGGLDRVELIGTDSDANYCVSYLVPVDAAAILPVPEEEPQVEPEPVAELPAEVPAIDPLEIVPELAVA